MSIESLLQAIHFAGIPIVENTDSTSWAILFHDL